jgi:hypothetical protein
LERSKHMVRASYKAISACVVSSTLRRPFTVVSLVCFLAMNIEAAAFAEGAPRAGAPPKVDLGRLLQLPDSYQQASESRRGLTRSQWEGRFERTRLEWNTAQEALETAKTELEGAAGDSGQWSVAAPGTSPNPENTPLSYKLRQEIRRQREAVERTERLLRDLEIEANLAEVPADWRVPDVGQKTDGSVTDGHTTSSMPREFTPVKPSIQR